MVGSFQETAAVHPSPALALTSVNAAKTGASSSFTITLKEHVDVLPAASVAVYVTTVVPNGKTAPGLLLLLNVTVQLSEAVGGSHVAAA